MCTGPLVCVIKSKAHQREQEKVGHVLFQIGQAKEVVQSKNVNEVGKEGAMEAHEGGASLAAGARP